MKILVVEDDRAVAQTLQLLMTSDNYVVDVAVDGEAGLQMAEAFEYDLVLLDVLLPKLDGISLCQQLRAKGFQMPILLLTGQGSGHQKAVVLDAGADDYVVKPFNSEELMARVRALLRRGDSTAQPILTWEKLCFDPNCRRVTYGTHLLVLTPKEYAILELLLRNSQTIFSARAILDHAWTAAESPGEEAVRVHIKGLRQKLTVAGAPKNLIKTVYRVGYQLNPIYSSALSVWPDEVPSVSQVAEFQAVNEQLRSTLEELQVASEELHQQNEELQRAQEKIAQERQHYQDLFEFAPDGYLVTDLHGTIREANRAAIALLGTRRLLGKPFVVFVTKTDRPLFRTRLVELESMQNWEITLKPRNGDPVPVLITFTPIRDSQDQITQLRWALRDIRERKYAEQQLQAAQVESAIRENEQLLRLALAGAQAGSWDWQLSTGQLTWSPETYRLYGLDPAEKSPKYGDWYAALLHPDDRAWVNTYITQVLEQRLPDIRIEFRILHPQLGIRWLLSLGHLIVNEVGEPVRLSGINLDITDRKQTELTLQEREQRLSAFVRDAPVSVAMFDREMRYLAASQRWVEMYHLESIEAVLGHCHYDLLAIPERWRQVNQQALTGMVQRCEEDQYSLSDGSLKWLKWEVQPWQTATGEIGGILIFVEDISERKQAEFALRESEEKYRSLFNSIDEGYFLADVLFDEADQPIDLFYRDANPAATQIMGRDFVGQRLREIDPTYESYWYEIFGRVACTGVGERLEQYAAPDQKWFDFYVFKVGDENSRQIAIIFRDITDRKQAEQTIRSQAMLLDIATDAIVVRDLNHRILYWNQGAERMYGWTATEAIGQKANELLQENATQVSEVVQTTLEQGMWHGELRKLTKTGQEVIVAGRWTLVCDERGQPQSFLTVNTDITEKKSLEEKSYHAQRLESLGTLASGIAHDLNNVLTPVLTIAQLLRQMPTDLERRSQMLQVLEESAKRGANLVKQIVTFARGSNGDRVLIQISDLLREVIEVVQQTFPKSITIRSDLPSDSLGLISADSTQLHQVLMNLCVNARDAMPDGGVLTLSVQNCTIDERFAQLHLDAHVGEYGVITVADTGTGIPPDVRSRIFDPFFTTKPVGQGTGLGLSTALGIVRSHGGFLQVSSMVGQGSQFRVYLPITVTRPTGQRSLDVFLEGNGEQVLLVEDDLAVQITTQALLEDHHYTILTARDGIEAIALYAEHRQDISVVVMDVMMPNMDGLRAIHALKSLNPTVKIIAVSGLSLNRDAVLAAGAALFLEKPYRFEGLLRAISNLIHNQHPDQ